MNSLLTNTSAMVALQNLRTVNTDLARVQEQISTGKKIGSARDNAAIFAISTVMQSDVKGFEAIESSLNLGSSTVAVARGAAEQVTNLLTEMKGLIVAAQEENVDRAKIQTDVAQLKSQIDSIVDAAQFNGLNLLKGGGDISILASLDRQNDQSVVASDITVSKSDLQTAQEAFGAGAGNVTTTASAASIADAATETVTLTAGAIAEGESFRVTLGGTDYEYVARDGDTLNDVVSNLKSRIDDAGISGIAVSVTNVADPEATNSVISITNTSGAAVTLTAANASGGTAGGGLEALATLDVSTAVGAESALAEIETLIQTAVDASAEFGSSQKRIDIQTEFVSNLTDALKTGIGALTDADLEEASARLQSLQVQQQLGIQALSIANQSPNSVLSLFR